MSDALGREAEMLLKKAAIVFWDFDGVIKDSLMAKSVGFEQLFLPYGRQVAQRVRRHHESHGGVSRFEKMPLYLSWAGEPATAEQVDHFCQQFSRLVLRAVIESAWVPGVREYLQARHADQRFVLMTATPQQEIEHIVELLDIAHFFREIHGAPKPKSAVIRDVLQRWQLRPEQTLAVGDSETDLNAAEANGVDFLLRRTPLNQDLQRRFQGASFDHLDFASLIEVN